jgi:hypothetical protein
MKGVEPPTESELFDNFVEPIEGDWDRDYWVEHCVQFLGMDPSVAEEKSTAWLVGWYDNRNNA